MEPDRPVPKVRPPRVVTWAIARLPVWITILLAVVAVLNLAGLVFGSLPGWTVWLLDVSGIFATAFLSIFIEALPFLLLGVFASGLVEVWVGENELRRWVSRPAFLAVLAGSLLGFFLPVSEIGVIPLARRLLRKGLPVRASAALLLAAPTLNPIVIASTLAAFGPGFIFWGRFVLTFVIAFLVGLFFSRLPSPYYDRIPVAAPQSSEPSTGFHRVLAVAVDEFFDLGRYLVAGAALAAFLQVLFPPDTLLQLGQGPLVSVPVLLALSALLSNGSAADAFFAQGLVGAFPAGSVLALLVFGAMADVKSVLMYRSIFSWRATARLVFLPLLLTASGALFLNLLVGGR